MHLDPLLPHLVGILAVVLAIGLLLQALRQPQRVGYILAGLVIGPYGLRWTTEEALIGHLRTVAVTLRSPPWRHTRLCLAERQVRAPFAN